LGIAKPVSGSDVIVRGVDILEFIIVCVNPGLWMATLRTFLAVGYEGALSTIPRGYEQTAYREDIESRGEV